MSIFIKSCACDRFESICLYRVCIACLRYRSVNSRSCDLKMWIIHAGSCVHHTWVILYNILVLNVLTALNFEVYFSQGCHDFRGVNLSLEFGKKNIITIEELVFWMKRVAWPNLLFFVVKICHVNFIERKRDLCNYECQMFDAHMTQWIEGVFCLVPSVTLFLDRHLKVYRVGRLTVGQPSSGRLRIYVGCPESSRTLPIKRATCILDSRNFA